MSETSLMHVDDQLMYKANNH